MEAYRYYKSAADQGDAIGQIGVGSMYYPGLGVRHDYREALKWYEMAAEQDSADAQNQIGLCISKDREHPKIINRRLNGSG